MALRKFLLPLTGTEAGEAALATALMAATGWGAHLCVLHTQPDGRDVAAMASEGLSGSMMEEMMRVSERESTRRATAARAQLQAALHRHGVAEGPAQPGQEHASAELLVVSGRAEDQVAWHARLADATIVARPEGTEEIAASEALHAALFDSGRPVLVAPSTAPASLGHHLCLAWSGSPESAAAARYGIPWMQRAARVSILTAREYQRRGPSATELAAYLALHGVDAAPVAFTPLDKDVGAGLLAAVTAQGADLLVMGAYSSSRLRQMILGGVTRHVLEHATLPVLMCR